MRHWESKHEGADALQTASQQTHASGSTLADWLHY